MGAEERGDCMTYITRLLLPWRLIYTIEMDRVINIMKIVRLFSVIILIGAYLSADSNSANLPAPIPIDFGVNYGMRSDSTICESCNQEYDAEVMGASCCDEAT